MKKEQLFKSACVIVAMLITYNFYDILKWLHFPFEILPDNDYLRYTVFKSFMALPIIVTVLLLFREKIVGISGLTRSPIEGFGVALVSCLHLFVAYAIFFDFNQELTGQAVYNKGVLSSFFEELVYRALFFGTLYGLLQWKFIPAVMLNAAIFSFGHLYQANDWLSSLMTIAVTVIGAVWFAWLYIRWNYNLWVPIFMHFLMNFSWFLFDVADGTAGGGWVGYVGRALTIAISVWLTLKKTDPMRPLSQENHNKTPVITSVPVSASL